MDKNSYTIGVVGIIILLVIMVAYFSRAESRTAPIADPGYTDAADW